MERLSLYFLLLLCFTGTAVLGWALLSVTLFRFTIRKITGEDRQGKQQWLLLSDLPLPPLLLAPPFAYAALSRTMSPPHQ